MLLLYYCCVWCSLLFFKCLQQKVTITVARFWPKECPKLLSILWIRFYSESYYQHTAHLLTRHRVLEKTVPHYF